MNGVTGRMGTNQHLVRSVLAIRAQGGVVLANGDRVMPAELGQIKLACERAPRSG